MLDCRSRIVYERKRDSQVFYVLPQAVETVFGKLPVVPLGDTGTIPFTMRQNARDFVDAAFDTSERSGDGSRWCCRWWYINTWAHDICFRGTDRHDLVLPVTTPLPMFPDSSTLLPSCQSRPLTGRD